MIIFIVHLNSTAHSVRSFRTLYFDIVRGRVSNESFRLVHSFNVLYFLDVRGGFPTSIPPRVYIKRRKHFSRQGGVPIRVFRLRAQ